MRPAQWPHSPCNESPWLAVTRRWEPQVVRDAVAAVEPWLRDPELPPPDRAVLVAAVRLTARALAEVAPGSNVEVRIPPFIAVQCVSGPRHTRGTPPNVVETDGRTWLLLATGLLRFQEAVVAGELRLSGLRAGEITAWFPLVSPIDPAGGQETSVRFPL